MAAPATPLTPASGYFRDALPSSSRYDLLFKIASGGMATVYVGGLSGAQGFRRIVAIKRAHPHLLEDPVFKSMLVAEAKMASLVRHPNVIGVHDVEELEGELLLVMEYIEGASLAQVIMAGTAATAFDAPLAMRIVRDACEGLHAIHQLKDDDGNPLGLVHRDISPQNILVGIDGMARVADFGIAKASAPEWAAQHTATGALRGKTGYMAPEYVETCLCEPQSDVFSLGVVAWEALTRRRLFKGTSDVETIKLIRTLAIPPPSSIVPSLPHGLDEVILRALARDPADRLPTARAFGEALEDAMRKTNSLATHGAVEERMRVHFGEQLGSRRATIRALMTAPVGGARPMSHSEVMKVVPPDPNGTPVTKVPSAKSPISAKSRLQGPLPGVINEETSGSGASLDIPAPKPKRILAATSAVLGVFVVALAMVAIGLAKSPVKMAAASIRDPGAAASASSPASTATTPAADPKPVTSTIDAPTVDVQNLPQQTSVQTASKPTRKSPAPTRNTFAIAAPTPVASAPTPTIQPTADPVTTKAVPKNPYAP